MYFVVLAAKVREISRRAKSASPEMALFAAVRMAGEVGTLAGLCSARPRTCLLVWKKNCYFADYPASEFLYNPLNTYFPLNTSSSLREDLHSYLLSRGAVDERLPECPDVEEKWNEICEAYLPDGVREWNDYPTVALGWPMFLGLAVAQLWDTDWARWGTRTDLYATLRDVRGFDCMDEYILEEILRLSPEEQARTSDLVGRLATRALSHLRRSSLEPSTPEAYRATVEAMHQLYLMGMAVRLKSLGYHMEKMA